MKRRTLLQRLATLVAALPLDRVRLFAQPRELTPDAVATLHAVAATVLPASIGGATIRDVSDKFVAWTRGYREGVALAHGYGHPRLVKSGASPVPGYVRQLAALEAEALRRSSGRARAKGSRWAALDLETRRGDPRRRARAGGRALAAAAADGAARRRRPDGVLFPEQRGQRPRLQRADQPRGLPSDCDHDAQAGAASRLSDVAGG